MQVFTRKLISKKIVQAQLGGMSGLCLSFQGWALKKKGPVLVSVFSPIGTVCSTIFSAVTLGYTVNMGRYVLEFLLY